MLITISFHKELQKQKDTGIGRGKDLGIKIYFPIEFQGLLDICFIITGKSASYLISMSPWTEPTVYFPLNSAGELPGLSWCLLPVVGQCPLPEVR